MMGGNVLFAVAMSACIITQLRTPAYTWMNEWMKWDGGFLALMIASTLHDSSFRIV
jgi:hypothetical protein